MTSDGPKQHWPQRQVWAQRGLWGWRARLGLVSWLTVPACSGHVCRLPSTGGIGPGATLCQSLV